MNETWLVTGAGGQLGSVLLRNLLRSDKSALGTASLDGPLPNQGSVVRLDIGDEKAVAQTLRRVRPKVIVHAAAMANVAAVLADPERAQAINVRATSALAALSAELGARFIYVSTDMVFNGEGAPYADDATPRPLSVYGRTKLEGEAVALAVAPAAVVRVPLLYGVPAVVRPTTFLAQLGALHQGSVLTLFFDESRTPRWPEDAARALVRVAESELTGVVHVAGPERLSRAEMGRAFAAALGVTSPNIVEISRNDGAAAEPRAADLSLVSARYESVFGEPSGRPIREALAEDFRNASLRS